MKVVLQQRKSTLKLRDLKPGDVFIEASNADAKRVPCFMYLHEESGRGTYNCVGLYNGTLTTLADSVEVLRCTAELTIEIE